MLQRSAVWQCVVRDRKSVGEPTAGDCRRRCARLPFLFLLRRAPALVAHQVRTRLPSARWPGWTRVLVRCRAADHHDLARGQFIRNAEDFLRLSVLRRTTEPGGTAAISEHRCPRQQALGEATFVICPEHSLSALENDRDPNGRAGEPADRRPQGRDLLQTFLVAYHDEPPRLAVLCASRPARELQELVDHVVGNRLWRVLTDLRYPTDRLKRRRTIAALVHVSAMMPE